MQTKFVFSWTIFMLKSEYCSQDSSYFSYILFPPKAYCFFLLYKNQLQGICILEKEENPMTQQKVKEINLCRVTRLWKFLTITLIPFCFPVLVPFELFHFLIIKFYHLFKIIRTGVQLFQPHMHPCMMLSGHIHSQTKLKTLMVQQPRMTLWVSYQLATLWLVIPKAVSKHH